MGPMFILDYEGNKKKVKIKNEQEVRKIEIEVISGDEIMVVTYKDGYYIEIDSCTDRDIDYFDGHYVLYENDKFVKPLKRWLKRKDSYELLYEFKYL